MTLRSGFRNEVPLVEMELGGGRSPHHAWRRLVGIAAAEAARDRVHRREGHGSRFKNRAVRKSGDSGNAYS
jgi:hypothetical protein